MPLHINIKRKNIFVKIILYNNRYKIDRSTIENVLKIEIKEYNIEKI